jgi:hypothetical protein
MNIPALISPPRIVVLDTSHLARLAADWASANRDQRRAAQTFIPGLLERGWLPLLCWHQLEELLQHRSEELVDSRLRFLWSWPLMAWIRSPGSNAGPGSILDVLRAEVAAAHAQSDADVLQVRELARDGMFSFGPATDAIPDEFRNWRFLRAALTSRQENAREVAAVSRWRASNIDNTRIADWIDRPLRKNSEITRTFKYLQNNLISEITTRGDKRISDPVAVAGAFFSEISRSRTAIATESDVPPAIQILLNAGLDIEDIDPSATLAETMNLIVFHNRLRIVAKANGLPFQELKRTVTRKRLPVTVIEEAMRIHAHDQPERKGSDLNDVHLLCLAPYADVTYVDKRTLESVRRAKRTEIILAGLIGHVRKVGSYGEIFNTLIDL